jgi:methyl-accepting chemotaxis protein
VVRVLGRLWSGLRSLTARLVLMSVLTATLACGALALISFWQQTRLTGTALDREMRAQYESVTSAITYEARGVFALATAIANLPHVQAAFAAGDRAALKAELSQSFAALKKSQGTQSIVMFQAPATAFFRVHEPEKFGDDAGNRRQMVLRATRSGESHAGIEPGRAGLFMFGTVPIFHSGAQIGAVDVGLNFGAAFAEEVKKVLGVDIAIHFQSEKGFATVASTLPEKTTQAEPDFVAAIAGDSTVKHIVRDGRPYAVMIGAIKDFSGKPVAAIEMVQDASDYAAISEGMRLTTALTTIGVLAVAILLAFLTTLAVVRPLRAMTGIMDRLARGERELDVPHLTRRDEIGTMAAAVDVFKHGLVEAERLRVAQDEAAQGAEARRRSEMLQLANAFEAQVKGVVKHVASAASEMEQGAQFMATSTGDTRSQASSVAGAAEEVTMYVLTVGGYSVEV